MDGEENIPSSSQNNRPKSRYRGRIAEGKEGKKRDMKGEGGKAKIINKN